MAYAFASDFLRDRFGGDLKRVLAYAPFAVLSVFGPGLRLAAAVRRFPQRGMARSVIESS